MVCVLDRGGLMVGLGRDGWLVGFHGALPVIHLGRLVMIDGWARWRVVYGRIGAACI